VTPIAETDPNVAFQGIPPVAQAAAPTGPEAVEAAAQPADPLDHGEPVATCKSSEPANPGGQPAARPLRRRAQRRLLAVDVDAVEAGQVPPQDLSLGLLGQRRVAALFDDVAR